MNIILIFNFQINKNGTKKYIFQLIGLNSMIGFFSAYKINENKTNILLLNLDLLKIGNNILNDIEIKNKINALEVNIKNNLFFDKKETKIGILKIFEELEIKKLSLIKKQIEEKNYDFSKREDIDAFFIKNYINIVDFYKFIIEGSYLFRDNNNLNYKKNYLNKYNKIVNNYSNYYNIEEFFKLEIGSQIKIIDELLNVIKNAIYFNCYEKIMEYEKSLNK